jgi:type I restriction enzyme S subunit
MDIFEKYPNSIFLKGLPDDSDFFPLRKRIDELFRFLDGLEDSNFGQGLDQDPHARLWEMMLAKIIKSEGYQPESADDGPDFVVRKDGKRVFVEAVCPGPGDEDNPNSVPSIVYGALIASVVPVAQIILRICTALDDKRRKYAKYLAKGIVSENDICIIAGRFQVPSATGE